MTNDERIPKREIKTAFPFVIRNSFVIRHSKFVIRGWLQFRRVQRIKFPVPGFDQHIGAIGHDFSEQNAPAFKPDQIRLAVQPWVITWFPRGGNSLLSFANEASRFGFTLAHRTIHPRRSATDFAFADIDRSTLLKG